MSTMNSREEIFPVVKSPSTKKLRKGRGFSMEELKQAGVTIELAKKIGIRIDKRRKSVRQENVEKLKELKSSYEKEHATPKKDIQTNAS